MVKIKLNQANNNNSHNNILRKKKERERLLAVVRNKLKISRFRALG